MSSGKLSCGTPETGIPTGTQDVLTASCGLTDAVLAFPRGLGAHGPRSVSDNVWRPGRAWRESILCPGSRGVCGGVVSTCRAAAGGVARGAWLPLAGQWAGPC